MNEYIQITVDGVTYYMLKQPDDSWLFTQRISPLNGIAATIITFTVGTNGVVVNTNDERLAMAVAAFVDTSLTPSGTRMNNYYPEVIKVIKEFQALFYTLGFDIDFFRSEIYLTMDDAFLQSMGEERINQWEKALDIEPDSTASIEDRREVIMARIRGGYKLNTDSINDIVNTFTKGSAESWFDPVNSRINVEITPPPTSKAYKFTNVVKELQRRIPAHLTLSVTRNYFTWNDIKEIKKADGTAADWQYIKNNFEDWEAVRRYVPADEINTKGMVFYGN